MTAQLTDQYIFKNELYEITAIESPLPFDPTDYGVFPVSYSPTCQRGYFGYYGMRDGRLCVRNLYTTTDGRYPDIMGINAIRNSYDFFLNLFHIYREINIPVDYSGAMFIGRDLVEDFYEMDHGREHYAFKIVYLLKFEKGEMCSARNVSDKMQKIRDDIICDTNYFRYDETTFSFVRNPDYDSPYDVDWEQIENIW